ncbi:uncharacterized protein LOC100906080 [Galendromus occidentalis]|uniref:Uncharacterized protein LOC100906080 n=1 Tax=Galendromus occidentalis TaxID=34638 RepID=A0AAJ6QW28_9ACAR|nr:uncharacterized protein LOC100906080 [Galendromus occidentalis]
MKFVKICAVTLVVLSVVGAHGVSGSREVRQGPEPDVGKSISKRSIPSFSGFLSWFDGTTARKLDSKDADQGQSSASETESRSADPNAISTSKVTSDLGPRSDPESGEVFERSLDEELSDDAEVEIARSFISALHHAHGDDHALNSIMFPAKSKATILFLQHPGPVLGDLKFYPIAIPKKTVPAKAAIAGQEARDLAAAVSPAPASPPPAKPVGVVPAVVPAPVPAVVPVAAVPVPAPTAPLPTEPVLVPAAAAVPTARKVSASEPDLIAPATPPASVHSTPGAKKTIPAKKPPISIVVEDARNDRISSQKDMPIS